jgi:RNA polymerase subunit RPABC4/transcription elongation factor Spt4
MHVPTRFRYVGAHSEEDFAQRAVCRECGVDNTVPQWMGEVYLLIDEPAAFFLAAIDAKRHNLAEHA